MRAAFAILSSCVLLALTAFAGSAQAGDYYDGYQPRRSSNVWYSSDCCYKKVVRHVRQVRYVRTEPVRRYSDHYYDRPHRSGYYEQPYRYSSNYYVAPRRQYVSHPYAPRYNGGYNAYNAAYTEPCRVRRVPVLDGRGGWVWGHRQVCN